MARATGWSRWSHALPIPFCGTCLLSLCVSSLSHQLLCDGTLSTLLSLNFSLIFVMVFHSLYHFVAASYHQSAHTGKVLPFARFYFIFNYVCIWVFVWVGARECRCS